MRLQPFAGRGRSLLLLAVFCQFAAPWALQNAAAQTSTADDGSPAIDQAERLADGNFASRQQAMLEMWRGRTRSRQAVQDAARADDPEVAERAEWILNQWRSGALPGISDTPPGMLLHASEPHSLATALEQGAFAAVVVAVEESAGTIEFDQIKSRVARYLTERFPIYADKAFHDGSEAELLRLINAVAIDRNLATAARNLMIHLGLTIDDMNRLPSAASTWSEAERKICLAQFAMLRGQTDQSIELARQSGDPVLLRISQMLSGHWQAIADDAFAAAQSATEAEERVEQYAWGLAAAIRSQDNARVELATEQLRQPDPDEPETLRDLRWRSLSLHSNVDAAIDVLAQSDKALAARIACSASRFPQAIELCGYPIDSIDSDLDVWIDDAYRSQAALASGEMAPEIDRLFSLARVLVRTGDIDNAWRIYRRLTPREIIISPNGISLRDKSLNELDLVHRLDWMVKLAVSTDENAAGARTRSIVAWALDTEYEAFQTVLESMKAIERRSDFQHQFRATCDLFRGLTPEQFDSETDFQKLYDLLAHHRQVERSGGRVVQVERVALDLKIIDMFLLHGQVELARQGIQLLSSTGDLEAMIRMAELESDQGDGLTARALWDQIAIQSSAFTATEAVITVGHGLDYAKSIVGQWILAKRARHHEQAAQLQRRIRLMLCSPSLGFRKDLADYLRQVQQYPLAVETLRELIVLASFGGEESPDFFSVAIAYVGVLDKIQETQPQTLTDLGIDPHDTLKWSDLAALGILKNTRYHDSAFVSVPLSVRKTKLQHAITANDAALASQAIAEIEAYDPLNIDFAERMLPELKTAGMTDVADAALQRLFDRGAKHLQQFGGDATMLNNLAWTAAMNNQHLEEALEWSERAVLLEPDSVVYRDTLAEVLHLLGRTDQALQVETACLLDEPDQWHLHEQIAKYKKVLDQQ
ncbi:hypothetical protein NHH03_21315 [Stieleria sp. TO1_6]|uniref:hypothetical protein n=1 Tax=Stieleria tagensis TaxID=2956795 RepID=UPI00209B0E4C|nr:hypothetical protein [Stieleria tagensis]MCO8124294.1 hypothetical protein [Stieleria tagensis]